MATRRVEKKKRSSNENVTVPSKLRRTEKTFEPVANSTSKIAKYGQRATRNSTLEHDLSVPLASSTAILLQATANEDPLGLSEQTNGNSQQQSHNAEQDDEDDMPSTSQAALKRRRKVKVTQCSEPEALPNTCSTTTVRSSLQRLESNCSEIDQLLRSSHNINAHDISDEYSRNSPWGAGKVMSIHLTNFMCHPNFVINFNPHITFIKGNNGSGKSAIASSIALALGCKARTTDRWASVKQFIRNGEQIAKIELTLSNTGRLAFMPETFGSKIIVIRTISQKSYNGYTLKNERGEVISKKVDDLHKILHHFNLQADNPMFVLSQDQSRQFIREAEPSNVYNFFLKATLLGTIGDWIDECVNKFVEDKNVLKSTLKILQKRKEEVSKLGSDLRKYDSIVQYKAILADCERGYEWAKVIKLENEHDEIQNEIGDKQHEFMRLRKQNDNKEARKKELNEKIGTLSEKIEEKEQIHTDLDRELGSKKNQCIKIQSDVKYAKETIAISRRNEQRFIRTFSHIQKKHEQRVNRVREFETIQTQNQNEISSLTEEQNDLKLILDTANNDINTFQPNAARLQEEIRYITQEMACHDSEINNLKTQLSALKNKNPIAAYGEHMTRLVAEIDRYAKAGKFEKKPIGPLGPHIQVTHEKYRKTVEQLLNYTTKAFLVNSGKDRNVLMYIVKQKFPQMRPTIIVKKFQDTVYNISQGKVKAVPGSINLVDVIKCSEPNVMNCLIDQLRVEVILITDNLKIAEHICKERENVPRNLMKVLVPQDTLIMEFHPAPKYRFYSSRLRPGHLIQVNLDDQKGQIQNDIQDIIRERKKKAMKKAEKQKELEAIQKLIQEKRLCIIENEKKRRLIGTRLSELEQNILELENPDQDDAGEYENAKKELDRQQEGIAKKSEELANMQRELDEISKRIEELNKLRERALADLEAAKNQKVSLLREIREYDASHEVNCHKIESLQNVISQLNLKKAEKEKLLNEALSRAEKYGERIHVKQTEQEILDEMAKAKSYIKEMEAITDNPDELRDLLRQKTATMKADNKKLGELNAYLSKIEDSLLQRKKFIITLQSLLACKTKTKFAHLLAKRSFSGDAVFNYNARTLELKVIPRKEGNEKSVSGTKSLSGGERSYTTVALLLAMWSCVQHPFFLADEYDVFTDVKNREEINKLLIQESDEHPSRQYIYLTPLDLTLTPSDKITIWEIQKDNNA